MIDEESRCIVDEGGDKGQDDLGMDSPFVSEIDPIQQGFLSIFTRDIIEVSTTEDGRQSRQIIVSKLLFLVSKIDQRRDPSEGKIAPNGGNINGSDSFSIVVNKRSPSISGRGGIHHISQKQELYHQRNGVDPSHARVRGKGDPNIIKRSKPSNKVESTQVNVEHKTPLTREMIRAREKDETGSVEPSDKSENRSHCTVHGLLIMVVIVKSTDIGVERVNGDQRNDNGAKGQAR